MAEVIIAGVGQTQVREMWDVSLRELAFSALEAAQADAGGLRPQALFVGNMLAPGVSQQSHIATLIADFSGLLGVEAVAVEAAGASGGAALRMGYLSVVSGANDVVAVVGVEKMTDLVGSPLVSALSTTLDSDYEAVQGLTVTSQAALLMRRYIHEFEVPREAFAGFPVTAHANGAGNPNAMFRRAIKPKVYQRAGIVSDPLNLFDIAPSADGAAAVILSRPGVIPHGSLHRAIRISGSSLVTDTLSLHDRPDPLAFNAARLSVERSCRQAIYSPDQMDLFEIHDAFSIYAALSLEAAGFAEPGQGWVLAQNGAIAPDGQIPVSTFGGLKARGYPGGATGVYQVVEATLQLRGSAGDLQIPDARLALVQSLGGPASTAVTHVLEALD